MARKSESQFYLFEALGKNSLVGHVAFSPAPQPGVLTELARFEAERVLAHAVREEIAAGRL